MQSLQDSFVSRDQGNRNGDIEMGMERQTNDQGLEDFFKQVTTTNHNNA